VKEHYFITESNTYIFYADKDVSRDSPAGTDYTVKQQKKPELPDTHMERQLTETEKKARDSLILPFERTGKGITQKEEGVGVIYLDEDDDAFAEYASDPEDEIDI